jgi:uncharacterized protein
MAIDTRSRTKPAVIAKPAARTTPHRTAAVRRDRPTLAGRPDPTRVTRQLGPAGRVLVVGLVCFGLWSLLAAPGLKRSAEGSPIGLRRTASLAVLRPLSRISAFLGLDRVGRQADRMLGRTRAPIEEGSLPSIPPLVEPTPQAEGSSAVSENRSSPAHAGIPSSVPLVLPPPSAKHPVRVLVVGDSVAGDLGYGLARLLSGKRYFSLKIDARTSTGLARNDYFNWPYQLALNIRSYRPTIVVALFGGNDTQGFFVHGRGVLWGTPEWKVQYRRRVSLVMNEVTRSGRPLIWVGMPIVASSDRNSGYRILNRIYQSEAKEHDGVAFVDAWSLFTDWRGRYATYLRAPNGSLERVREGDGFHLSAAGGNRFADAVFRSMRRFWRA